MTLQLNAALQQQLHDWAREGYPLERCGLLVGSASDGVVQVRQVIAARNAVAMRANDRYEIDPYDFLRADAIARERQLEIVGVWHTHPDHPACPSTTDREGAWDGWSYLIVAVGAAGIQALRSWRLQGGDFVEEELRE